MSKKRRAWLNAHKLVKAEHVIHLTYFALIVVGGPYSVAAGACFLIGVTVLIVGHD